MRQIERTKAFKRDFKKILYVPKHKNIEALLRPVLELLCFDKPLPHKNFDHALTGAWKDHRDCHIKPDLILIYRKVNEEVLQLVRLGSHSELGLC